VVDFLGNFGKYIFFLIIGYVPKKLEKAQKTFRRNSKSSEYSGPKSSIFLQIIFKSNWDPFLI
jgi:hypothetical protein